ncbi:MAG: hypothetical protein HYS17_00060 [Micavibrio aeruginosavorus]|uniref:Uncharacterized protein n=1 Tax=Micavibrio aeruginosavorus TaxID=349221 RepID=A0A7T5R2C5_9BACT|nr:MAG: hypothetical protein HYS17_00060 [Micavibrio aeruginosavorus]
MPAMLPRDSENNIIPVVRLKDGAAHAINATASSARNSTAFSSDTQIISLYATVPVRLRFGGAGVTATTSDHYFPAGVYYDVSIGGGKVGHYPYLAVLREGGSDGVLYISEKE